MSGFVEFIVACSWDTLLVLLMLFQFISMALRLSLLFIFARSGVDILAGFGANVGFISLHDICVVTAVWKRLKNCVVV